MWNAKSCRILWNNTIAKKEQTKAPLSKHGPYSFMQVQISIQDRQRHKLKIDAFLLVVAGEAAVIQYSTN